MIYNKDGTVFTPDEYSDGWIWDVSKLIAYATPEMRETIRRKVDEYVRNEDAHYVIDGYCDYSKAVELGKARWTWGVACLYVWLDRNGIPFYAGKSDVGLARMSEFKHNTRSDEFKKKISEGGCHAVLVAKHISPRYIDEIEKWLISYLCWKGYPLVNKKDLPGKEKMVLWSLFDSYEKRADVARDFGEDAAELYGDWCTDMRDYKPIIGVLEDVIGTRWCGECAV